MVTAEDEKKLLYEACSAWYQTPAGLFAMQRLQDKIQDYISKVFGYYAMESGVLLNHTSFLESSRIGSCFALGRGGDGISIKAETEALPLDFDSIDLIIASHVLECSDNPHQVLREFDRVLVADGHCIFIGFNPLSLWQSSRSFCPSGTGQRPHLYGVSRMRDWLSLLGWNIEKISYVSFRPSFVKGRFFKRMEKMEKWGSLYWPIFGNLYIIHAQKQVVSMTARRKKEWDPAAVLPPKVAINTTSRSGQLRDKK